jgi:hypothetical protein
MLGLRFALLQPHQRTWPTDGTMDWLIWLEAAAVARDESSTFRRDSRTAEGAVSPL